MPSGHYQSFVVEFLFALVGASPSSGQNPRKFIQPGLVMATDAVTRLKPTLRERPDLKGALALQALIEKRI
jgi:hypothetical protein